MGMRRGSWFGGQRGDLPLEGGHAKSAQVESVVGAVSLSRDDVFVPTFIFSCSKGEGAFLISITVVRNKFHHSEKAASD